MDTSQYMTMFLEESMDNLQTLNESLLELEQNPDDIDKLNEIFRVAHTIKGMAATMGFSDIAELTHKMEDVLSEFREGELKVTQEVVTVLFDCLDTLEKMVSNVEEESDEQVDIKEIMDKLISISQGGVAAQASEKSAENNASKAEASEDESLIELNEYDLSVIKQAKEKGFNILNLDIKLSENTLLKSARAFLIVKDLEEVGEIIKSEPSTESIENEEFDFELKFTMITSSTPENIKELVEGISEVESVEVTVIKEENLVLEGAKEEKEVKPKEIEEAKVETVKPAEKQDKVPAKKEEGSKKSSGKKAHQSVRVDLERIDKLMNMVSELVIYRTRLEQIVVDNKSPELTETLEQVGRTTSDLQDLVMKIRMLPLDTVFNRFPTVH